MENRPNDHERIENLVKKAADGLIEHVDSVRIFVTYHEGDDAQTHAFTLARGNYYAGMGQIWDWLNQKRSETHHAARPPDEE